MGAVLKELHNSASKFQFPSMPNENVDIKRETAYQEYDIFNKTQPIESDFDKVVKGLAKAEN